MAIIAVNTKYVYIPELSISQFLKDGSQGEFKIESTERNLPIDVGNNIVFIKPQLSDLVFTNSGTIQKIGKRDFLPGKPVEQGKTAAYENKDKYHHHFNFKVEKTLHKNNRLSELEYSLPVVENYNKPETHFQSQYRTLVTNDFETIVNGWVYATRTVFGKLINALPRPNKLEFMIEAMDHFRTIDFRNTSLLDGLEFLYHYIDKRILSRGKLLVATDKILKSELSNLLPADQIGFVDPQTMTIFNINDQAKIFNSLFKLESERSLKQSLQDAVENNRGLETRFQKIFKRRSWPVDLEK